MKPIPKETVSNHGNMVGVSREFSLDQSALAHLMTVLTHTYSDPVAATIREPATNAWDSHQAAGTDEPILVSLPSPLNPVYIVQDHGVGMSVDTLLDIFTKYGASTKRGNNQEVGMLGLGCKAPLTYTSQFTIVSVHNGLRIVALVFINKQELPEIRITDTSSTDERNGVTLQIPVKENLDTFNKKARDHFKWWAPGSALVNDEDPSTWFEGGVIHLSDSVFLVPHADRNYNHSDYVVQGNVAYPVTTGYDTRISPHAARYSAVVRVPIGSLEFTPGRDALIYSDRTKKVLNDARKFVSEKAEAALIAHIEEAPDRTEAFRRAKFLLGASLGKATYQGEPIPYKVEATGWVWSANLERASKIRDEIKVEEINRYNPIVTGLPTATLTPTQRRKITRFFQEHGTDFGYYLSVLVLNEEEITPWAELDDTVVVSWEEIDEAITLPRAQRGLSNGEDTVKFKEYRNGHVYDAWRKDFDWSKTFVIVEEHEKNAAMMLTQSVDVPDVLMFVTPTIKSWNKFVRDSKNIPFKKAYRDLVKHFKKSVTPEQAWAVYSPTADEVIDVEINLPQEYLDIINEFDDPEISRLVWASRKSSETYYDAKYKRNNWDRIDGIHQNLFRQRQPKQPYVEPAKVDVTYIADNYPLLGVSASDLYGYGSREALRAALATKAVIEYANALYHFRQGA